MPANLVMLFEHQSRAYADLGLPPGARRERVLEEIEKLNENNGQEILRLGRRELRAGALVGMVRVGDLTIEILPKIDCVPPGLGDAAPSAVRNLLAMLSYACDLRILEQELAGVSDQPGSWFDLLTRLFAFNLYRQILFGLSHDYTTQAETLTVLRGRWDVQRQILRRGLAQPNFDVIHDDYSPDIPLNQVFRFVIEQLQPFAISPDHRLLLADLAEWFRPVTRLPRIPPDFLDSIHFTRLNERFQPAFNLARLFLTGSIIQLTHGKLPACAFVVDMNLLFERFVAAFLQRHRPAVLPADAQDAAVIAQSEGLRLYLGRSAGQNVLRLQPDLLFTRPGADSPLLVADTKYKLLSADRAASRRRPDPLPDDAYQMLAYTIRLGCPRGMLLYPQGAGEAPLRRTIHVPSAGLELSLATLNLRQPIDPPAALISELRNIFTWVLAQPG